MPGVISANNLAEAPSRSRMRSRQVALSICVHPSQHPPTELPTHPPVALPVHPSSCAGACPSLSRWSGRVKRQNPPWFGSGLGPGWAWGSRSLWANARIDKRSCSCYFLETGLCLKTGITRTSQHLHKVPSSKHPWHSESGLFRCRRACLAESTYWLRGRKGR